MRGLTYIRILSVIYIPFILITTWWLVRESDYGYRREPHYVEAGVFDPQEFDYTDEKTSDSSEISNGSENSISSAQVSKLELNNSIVSDNEIIKIFPYKSEVKNKSQQSLNEAVATSGFLIAAKFNSKAKINYSACVSELSLLECDNMGLAAMLLATLDHLFFCSIHNAIPTVLWRNCGTVCSNNSFFNSWEWYFEPVNIDVEKRARNIICLAGTIVDEKLFSSRYGAEDIFGTTKRTQFTPKPLLNLSFQRRNLPHFKSSGTISGDVRNWAYNILKKYVQVRKNIHEQVDTFYKQYMSGYNVLGVHIRGTDHWVEREQLDLVPLRTWYEKARIIFNSLQEPRKIFIASDNVEAIKYFLKKFGKPKVTFIKAIRAKYYNGAAVHNSGLSPQRLGSDILKDILLLTKCEHFLHGESSVAALASYFNPNLTSHWVEEHKTNDSKQPTSTSDETEKGNTRPNQSVTSTAKKYKKFSGDEMEIQHHKFINSKTDALQALNCFKRNSPFSACSNFMKGSFIKPEEVPMFFDQ